MFLQPDKFCVVCFIGVHYLRVEPVGAESSLETSNCSEM